jgi:hypothetical protein
MKMIVMVNMEVLNMEVVVVAAVVAAHRYLPILLLWDHILQHLANQSIQAVMEHLIVSCDMQGPQSC